MSDGNGAERSESTRLKRKPYILTLRMVGLIFLLITGMVGIRAGVELAMMSEHGPDPQMPIWYMSLAVKLALWSSIGLIGLLPVAVWRNRWGMFVGLVWVLVWTVAIGAASWSYQRAWRALADASRPTTAPERLRELVDFKGIQAGYELDNRIASNPSAPIEALRELYVRDNVGTLMCLARNPNTPREILEQLANHEDELVRGSLKQNPNLPPSLRETLKASHD